MHTTLSAPIRKRLDHVKQQFDDLSYTLQTNDAVRLVVGCNNEYALKSHSILSLRGCVQLSPEERGLLTKQLHAFDPVMRMVRRIEQQREVPISDLQSGVLILHHAAAGRMPTTLCLLPVWPQELRELHQLMEESKQTQDKVGQIFTKPG
jgi:hypothetical protein